MLGALIPAFGGLSSLVGGAGATSLLGGLFNPMSLGRSLFSQIAQNVVGQLGLPPVVSDMLRSGIESTLGPGLPGNPETNTGIADFLSKAFGVDLNAAQDFVDGLSELLLELAQKLIEDEEENRTSGEGANGAAGEGGGGSKSWIMAIAEKMGEIVDQAFKEWEAQADKVAGLQAKAEGDGDAAEDAKQILPSETVEMSAKLQQFNMLMQAANSGIKTAGQSAATMAGRQ